MLTTGVIVFVLALGCALWGLYVRRVLRSFSDEPPTTVTGAYYVSSMWVARLGFAGRQSAD